MASETVSSANMRTRLGQLGASFHKTAKSGHIYYSGASRRYILVKRHPSNPAYVVFEYHATCPCVNS